MSITKSYADKAGTWIIYLVLFSVGIDGLAYLLYAREPSAAFVCTPILLIWEAVVFVHFFRGFLPAYKSLVQTNPECSTAYVRLFQIAQTLPAIVAIVIWAMLPTFSSGRH